MFIALRFLIYSAPVRSGMLTERTGAHGAPLERTGIGYRKSINMVLLRSTS
jgi:hypothetical protein